MPHNIPCRCRTVACSTVAVPALTRAQYASAVKKANSYGFLRGFPRYAVLLAIAFMILAFCAIARADNTFLETPAVPAKAIAPSVKYCEVNKKGDLICASQPRKLSLTASKIDLPKQLHTVR